MNIRFSASPPTGVSTQTTQRRQIIKALLALGLTPATASLLSACRQTPDTAAAQELWVSAQGSHAHSFGLGWLQPGTSGQTAFTAATGFRGHGAVQHPLRPDSVLMISRQPGTECAEVNLLSGDITARFACQPGRHLHGHACFSADGRQLFTTESDFVSGLGKIVVRDATTYQWLGEFDSQGIGPHELKLMPDGKTLVVANGGLRTHPDSGRKILNLDTMRSSLTYLRVSDGALTDEQTLSERKASIRHLDVAADGTVAVATQIQRTAMANNHIVAPGAVHSPGKTLQPLNAPEALLSQFNDYMGSVAVHNSERVAAFSSPRGNLVAFWHLDRGELLGYHAFHDVCGLTVSHDQRYFVLSNSAGQLRRINARTLQEQPGLRLQIPAMHWDNHMISLTLNTLS
ncbi:MAG: DUF1513 domain-containing protein [Saccharospirillaceae bacterium]|nr:DUF1513 domain-containing protein [Saccharospirillaceae bacterium]MCD8530599.1 DUF1513 domain-containing protein [Saccharospirillaceae bacterium]